MFCLHFLVWFFTLFLDVSNNDNNVCPVEGCAHFLSSTVELQRHLHMHIFHAQRQHAGLIAITKKNELAHLERYAI